MTNNKAMPAPAEESMVDDDLLLEDGDEETTEVELGQVMHRPDGYYWQSPDGKRELGPFASLELALADMESAGEEGAEPGETLQEAEDEIGITDWIDPDTGSLAEGQSTPRFHDE